MTSGVILPGVFFGFWDRLRPPQLSSAIMCVLSIITLFSFTHGYLPYGSSDILLPTLVAICWLLEFLPLFGGPVDMHEYISWRKCVLAAVLGILSRAIDIKRKSNVAKRNLVMLYVIIMIGYGSYNYINVYL